ncbi:MAG: YkgJ family cysteine cluster protein [Planctomycetaceae bacterium]|nr:YkgJ family cysteine cluster protein [Planctomycetaceae bacterium]
MMNQPRESWVNHNQLRLLVEPASSCNSCGACCRLTPVPPFAPGECQQRNVPDEWLVCVTATMARDQQFELEPCVWYDPAADACQHYEYRPTACRSFEVGSVECASARRRVATQHHC